MRAPAILFVVGLCLSGCASTGPAPSSSSSSAPPAAETSGATPAPGSKFSQIHLGMDKAEVQSIIGPPTDQSSHMTPKVYIPFYAGADTTEIDAHYKGEGILTYASRQVGDTSYVLTGISVNTGESGFIQ